jgi:DNA-binding LacI/PurR family transcriptional regulator
MPSMRDVANLARVSVSTVSRVINENMFVEEDTKQRVVTAIEKLNYRPNLLAKGLRVKSGHLIGFAVPEISQPFMNFIRYMEEYVDNHDFNLILGNTHNNPNIEEKFIDNLIRRNVDGIIFSSVSDESRVLSILKKSNIPIVAIDRELEDQDVLSVILNNSMAGALAAEHLLRLGHKRIVCITGPLNIKLCREQLRGFHTTLEDNGISINQNYIYEGNCDFESGYRAMDKFISSDLEITAIWAQNDLMAFGAIQALRAHGIDVPGDVSIIGMDNLNISEMVTPSLTTIPQPFKEMCEKAVELIVMQKRSIEIIKKRIIIQPRIIVRESTAPVKNRFVKS